MSNIPQKQQQSPSVPQSNIPDPKLQPGIPQQVYAPTQIIPGQPLMFPQTAQYRQPLPGVQQLAPVVQPTVLQQPNNLGYSGVLQPQPQGPIQLGATLLNDQAVRGESRIEYVPFERTVTEYEEVRKQVQVPITRQITDYYAVQYDIEYIPQTIQEKAIEYVPVERIQERTEYVTVQKQNVLQNYSQTQTQTQTQFQPQVTTQRAQQQVITQQQVVTQPQVQTSIIQSQPITTQFVQQPITTSFVQQPITTQNVQQSIATSQYIQQPIQTTSVLQQQSFPRTQYVQQTVAPQLIQSTQQPVIYSTPPQQTIQGSTSIPQYPRSSLIQSKSPVQNTQIPIQGQTVVQGVPTNLAATTKPVALPTTNTVIQNQTVPQLQAALPTQEKKQKAEKDKSFLERLFE